MKASEICEHAAEMVAGSRAKTHGDKVENHANIAALWNAYLAIRRDPSSGLTALDAAHMMALLKIARTQAGVLNMDDYQDLAGYAGVSGEIAHAEQFREYDDD